MSVDERRLFVSWRRPDGLMVPVGLLTQRVANDGPRFRFVYLKNAELEEGFTALPGLPDRHCAYESVVLFPVFANRVMPRERPDYGDFLVRLDLPSDTDPFEVLGRSEGIRETDRIEVFPGPFHSEDNELATRFFARGIRHLEGASSAVEALHTDDRLTLVPQPDNPVNAHAMLLNAATGQSVGWAPNYLLDLIHDLDEVNGQLPTVTVEHVNPASTPAHLRLLCRLVAPWPLGYVPFDGPEFQPLAA